MHTTALTAVAVGISTDEIKCDVFTKWKAKKRMEKDETETVCSPATSDTLTANSQVFFVSPIRPFVIASNVCVPLPLVSPLFNYFCE